MENPQWWEKPRQPTNCKIHYMRGIQSQRKQRGNNLLSSSSPHAAAVTRWRQRPLSLSLSVSLARSVQLTLQQQPTLLHHSKSMCPKSYIYIYDFSAYLHICPSNWSKPIGTGSGINRFSVSSIRRDMFPNISILSLSVCISLSLSFGENTIILINVCKKHYLQRV